MTDLGFTGGDVESRVEICSRSFQRLARWRILSAISCVMLFLIGATYLFGSKDSSMAFLNLHMNTSSVLTSTSTGMNRRFLGTDHRSCGFEDISISQRLAGSPGMPEYIVQIANSCMSPCAPWDIHIACGWFASAPLVNPNVFRRIAYNDCLVNSGKALEHGTLIRFSYSNSFMYPLKVKSVSFC